jgi:hypothetical protein
VFAELVDVRVHWVFLVLSLLVLLLSMTLRLPAEEKLFLPIFGDLALPGLCYTREWLGIPCPGCGLTRCFVSLAHGQLGRAWHFNPAGILLFGLVLAQIPYRSVQLWRIYRGKSLLEIPNFVWMVYLMVAVLLIQWIAKLLVGYF